MESTEYQNNYENDQGQNYQNFQNQENNISSSNQEPKSQNSSGGSDMWYYLSIITWILFLITIWSVFLTNNTFNLQTINGSYYYKSPINSNLSFTCGLISIIGAFGFYFYFKSTTLEKDQGIYQGMIGDMSKFHCVPLLLISIIIILTTSLTKTGCIFEIIFSILACASLVFIYLQTDFEASWYIVLTTKKGVYSSLIALTWYLFWAFINIQELYKDEPSESFLKDSGIAFSILIGVGTIAFGVFFKDLVVLITNFLIYLGMVQYYYTNNLTDAFEKACPGIEITMLVVNFGAFIYLIWKETDSAMRT